MSSFDKAQGRLIVGLTGGIGCGKSTVAALFAEHGAGINDTDAIAHQLTQADGEAISSIRAAFGNDYLTSDGALDRAKMRGLIFSDAAAKQRLEHILHPLIREQAKTQLQQLQANGYGRNAAPDDETCHARFPLPNHLPIPSPQSSPASGRGGDREKQLLIPAGEGANESLREFHVNPYILVVVPLLPESPAFRQLVQRVLVVDCEENTQVARVIGRSRLTEKEVRAVIAQQTPRAERLQLADDIIRNDSGLDDLAEQVAALHERYLKSQNSN
ncbi:MAG: dephospho-CoA kinase [Gallionella sp.]|nr:dephospho-CoA kinase [Gallionella sp.]